MAQTPQEMNHLRGHIPGHEREWQSIRARRTQRAPRLNRRGNHRLRKASPLIREALVHIDGTLSLFDPDGNPEAIKAKRPYKRVKLFGAGKLNRLILDALRRGARPMTTQEVIDAVVAEVGFGPDAAKGMSSRVRSNLLYLAKVRGSVAKEGERETARWRLS